MADGPKKFRLDFVNAAEDVPGLIRAYGRACNGEFALVLRPPETRGVLVLVRKKEGALFWRGFGQDHPGMPSTSIAAADAVALVKTEQRALGRSRPITLRGQWAGWLHCDAGTPRVELVRKLAAYGTLRVVSDPTAGWTWTVERTEKWFSEPGTDTGKASTLIKAIEAGLARAMGLLGEACSMRDSRRRAAYDTSYASEHPIKPAREGKDPTERFAPKAATPAKAAAGGWTRIDGAELPDAEPIERPSRAVKARLKAGGLVHDAGAGSYLGTLVADFGGVAAGGLLFRPADGGAVFVTAAPSPAVRPATTPTPAPVAVPTAPPASPAPRKRRAAKDTTEPDAVKDKALLDAFSAALADAMTSR